jgi:NCS1 family nucleobase:cation symporter-1
LATVLGSLPMCPGFIMTLINSAASNGWVKLFNISFLVGIVLGFAIFATVGLVWPPPHLGIGLTYHDESLFASNDAVAQDARSSDSNADDEEKGVEGSKVDASVSVVPTLA